ncbi:two-component sensor histidine kinase [Fictibacillus arsenicus]|jgi:two-component system, NarL family, sensor histidine kinase LiaS|uniref:Sensor histidine kinase n=1 Tax=Fictibacillus arsenicus TaxID=255247 RepID=A0A1B1ZA13_9BACL|nr:sensor histidine kinase [Fictibacillus arsenicus]ANX14300.1 two-component sensor histidine kinase [Fictibacillus arsenicus]
MSTVLRHMFSGISLAFAVTILLGSVVYTLFPISDWNFLLEEQLLDFPIAFVVPFLVFIMGAFFGLNSGITARKQLNLIDRTLKSIEDGRQVNMKEVSNLELKAISKRMEGIQQQLGEKIRQSQKMATEKAVDQEKRIQEIISQERNRLARELHDSVSQQLFAASMIMSAVNEVREESETRESKQLKLVEETIHQTQLEMRALLLHLRPAALNGKSLQKGMEELLQELLQKVPIELKWKIETIPLDKGVEDHLFRILQESVSNILRHAQANKAQILLVQRDDLIILRIEDDGIGFKMEQEKTGSYGLQNMHERAAEIGGTLKIVSLPGEGTRLEVKVPILSAGEEKA